MAHDEHPNPNLYDDPSATPVLMVSVVGTLLFVATVVAVIALYNRAETLSVERVIYEPDMVSVQVLHGQQETALHMPRAIDAGTNVYGIPIERAMVAVVRELNAQAVEAEVEVEQP